MPRHRQRKINREFNPEAILKGLQLIKEQKMSCVAAAKTVKLDPETLRRYKLKIDTAAEKGEVFQIKQNYTHRTVFSEDVEAKLTDYILNCSYLGHGLTRKACREIAYQTGIKNGVKMPQNWLDRQMASEDWLSSYLKRTKVISLRKPEACSLGRATAFNKHNVNEFFDNLEDVINRHPNFQNGSRIFNLDETGTTTVQKTPPRILALKGKKQVYQNTSAEKGTLVTTCVFINARGVVYPPAMVFPRVNFQRRMLADCYPGTLGLSFKTGWMTQGNFVEVMRHFIKETNSSKENPSLLLYDNHESHISIDVLDLAKENGVTVLTLPPHTSHKLQPLDVSCFGPFGKAYDVALNNWMKCHPGETVTIYDVAALVKTAIQVGITNMNIISGFEATGIYPFNRNIFKEEDFSQSALTDRPNPEAAFLTPASDSTNEEDSEENIAGTSAETGTIQETRAPEKIISTPPHQKTKAALKEVVGPQDFLGYPKAGPRKNSRKGRKKGKTMVATDTPVKVQLEMDQKQAKEKKRKKSGGESKVGKRNVKRKLALVEESDESNPDEPTEKIIPKKRAAKSLESPKMLFPSLKEIPTEGDYVLTIFKAEEGTSKKNKEPIHFVGKIIKNIDEDRDLEVSYLRKSQKLSCNNFIMPSKPDLASISLENVVAILPKPTVSEGTKRQSSVFSFNFDFKNVKLG